MEPSSKVINCYEKWDYEAFERIRALHIMPKEVDRLLKKVELEPNADGRVFVRYTTKNGDPKGRLYGNLARQDEAWPNIYWYLGPSLQGMAKWVRHFVAHRYYRDFDITNCAPNLMEQILQKYNLCPASLIMYNMNRSALFDRYTRECQMSRDEVKQVFIGLLHMGKPDPRISDSVVLKRTLDQALRQLAKHPKYAPLYASMPNNKNTLGSFAYAVWSREEHLVLIQMREFFIQLGYHREHMVLCFDGLMIEKDPVLDERPVDLNALSARIKETTGYTLQIEEKSLVPTEKDRALLDSFEIQ